MKPYRADAVDLATFVGRQHYLRDVVSEVEAGRSVYLSAGRRIGKTMFLRMLATSLEQRGIMAPYIDLQSRTRSAEWFLGRLKDLCGDHASSSATSIEEVASSVVDRGKRLCICVDEVEVLSRTADGVMILDNLRYVVSNSGLTGDVMVVIAGGLDMVLSLRTAGSSLLNVCQPVDLEPFDFSEIRELVDLGVPEADRDRVAEFVYADAGGHPYIAQSLLETLDGPVPMNIAETSTTWRERMVRQVSAHIRTLDPLLIGEARSLGQLLSARSQPALRELLTSGLARRVGAAIVYNGNIIADAVSNLPTSRAEVDQANPGWFDDLLAGGETTSTEFKASLRWDVQRQTENDNLKYEAVDTIAGFANADGGTLVLGVADDGSVLGLENDLRLIRRNPTVDGLVLTISGMVRNAIGGPMAASLSFRKATVAGLDVLVISTAASPRPVFARLRGGVHFYCRAGTATMDFDPRETLEYALKHWPELCDVT